VVVVVLTEKVTFTAVLQKGNRFQVPKVVRWRFKMDTKQVLKVTVSPRGDHRRQARFFALGWIGMGG
jgi:hypothetical protein